LPIIIVFDALDECGTAATRGPLLQLLADDFSHLPCNIRIIVTSRADIDICDALEYQHHILAHELDLTSATNSNDILLYCRHRMAQLRAKKRHLRLAIDWPGEEVLQKLAKRASGLFVWASTAFEFIDGHDPRKRLDIILDVQSGPGAEAALDALYNTALKAVDFWDDEDFVQDFRDIVGVILIAGQPLPSSAIDSLLHLPNNRLSMNTVSLLRCVLQQDPTIRFLHPSFADFLTNRERCGRDIWFFDKSTYHRRLVLRCFDRMDTMLKRNVCNISLRVDQVEAYLPEDVSYACIFWIHHTCAVDDDLVHVMDRLHSFLRKHLLHWFEAMSILKRSRDTISLLDRLLNWISVGHIYIQLHHA
jgi:hypothetical protein